MSQSKSKSLDDIKMQLVRLDSVWQQCKQNLLYGFSSWALWELFNGYPTRDKTEELHQSIGAYSVPLHLNVMIDQLLASLLMALGRLVDPVGNGRGMERLAIDQLRIFLDAPEVSAFFQDSKKLTTFCNHVNIDESLWNSRFDKLKLRLDGHNRSLVTIRPTLKKFRDDRLAHSLGNATPSDLTVFTVRDAFALVAYILESWAFLFYGRVWSSKELGQREFDQAKSFWLVFADGLNAHKLQ